jgi:cytochrome c-type biogenesis protein CcmH/NrfG
MMRAAELMEIHKRLGQADLPDQASSHFVASAYAALAVGNVDDAMSLGEAAAAIDPTNARAWAVLGEARYRNNHAQQARDALERAVALDDDDLGTALLCARTQVATGAHPLARALLQFVIGRARGPLQQDADALLNSLPMSERNHG